MQTLELKKKYSIQYEIRAVILLDLKMNFQTFSFERDSQFTHCQSYSKKVSTFLCWEHSQLISFALERNSSCYLPNKQAMSINRRYIFFSPLAKVRTECFIMKCFYNWIEYLNLGIICRRSKNYYAHSRRACMLPCSRTLNTYLTYEYEFELLLYIYIAKCRQQFPNSIIKFHEIFNSIKYEICQQWVCLRIAHSHSHSNACSEEMCIVCSTGFTEISWISQIFILFSSKVKWMREQIIERNNRKARPRDQLLLEIKQMKFNSFRLQPNESCIRQ